MSWTIRRDLAGFPIRWSEEFSQEWRAAGYWRDETLADIAKIQTESAPDETLLIDNGKRISRWEIYEGALRLSGYFQTQGAKPGDVVAMQLPNWAESAVVALAARMTGLVINPIPPIYRAAELSYMLADTKARFLFIPQEFRKHDYRVMVEELHCDLPALQDVVVLRGDAVNYTAWEDAISAAPCKSLPKVDAGNAFMVMFTSGTTGRAKGVIQTHYTMGYKARQMAEAWNVTVDDVIFMPSPVSHITGATWAFDIPWISGACAVLMDVWNVEDGINAIAEFGCTISGGATPFLQQMLDASKSDTSRLASLRMFFCGGTSVAPELIKRASNTFPECLFFRAYGSTEMMTTTLGILSKDDAKLGAETDGIIRPPIKVKLVDDDGIEILEEGVEGEILVFGPEQFSGYLNTDDNTDAFDEDGYFRMGDLGCRVNENYLVITGRKKDIIIRSGENISPKEVEDVLMQHPAIAETAIVAMPSATTGEMCCAFVILQAEAEFDVAEMRRFLDGSGLARQKYPEWLEVVDDLPRVPSGKIKKDALRKIAKDIHEINSTQDIEKKLHPYYRAVVDMMAASGRAAFHEVTPARARQMLRDGAAAAPKPSDLPELADVVDDTIDSPNGPVAVRRYTPVGDIRGTCIYMHSGGWVIGDLDFSDTTCRRLCAASAYTIISVDYSLAPEHVFPRPLEDVCAVLQWADGNIPGPLVLAGESAGANLAAACAIWARDNDGPTIDAQVLFYPVTDCNFETSSYREIGERGWLLSTKDMRWFWDQYCPPSVDRLDPLVSPLRADDLSALPPAFVAVAELDPLRDEGLAYARRLVESGVAVESRCDAGMLHGYLGAAGAVPTAMDAMLAVAAWMKNVSA